MEWQPIETMPVTDTEDDDGGPHYLVWVADGGRPRSEGVPVRGRRRDGGEPRALGYSGNWKITHWCLVEPPKEAA